ncbi:MAG TPA: hypothetical protein VH394_15820 [Thermoanaerobaculia bacterium]|nr:hypothetical protein [Thermoanaerobaculia bacterium]
MLGAQASQAAPSRWEASTSWRYQRSDRHFRGTEEQVERQQEGSEVINTINLVELGIRYNVNDQWSLSLGIPYFSAERSSPIRNSNRQVVDRSVVEAQALGDIVLTARHLLLKPQQSPNANVSLGLGVKFPTGKDDVYDNRKRLVNGQDVFTYESVDQSIQPGDGGWGAVLDFQAYQRIRSSGGTIYASGSYLINPRDTNGVLTFRGSLGEEVMSVADQYLVRTGVSYSGAGWKGFGMSLGGRMEGVPVEDLIGDSNGFRRPGYALSVEPGLSYSRGVHTFSLAVPVAVLRDRQRSVPDRLVPGRHGDAAFADYFVMVGYWRKF